MGAATGATSQGRPIRTDAEVLQNRDESGANWRLRLAVPEWPGFGPGQFVMLSAGARSQVLRTDPLLPRPMAVYRARRRDRGAEIEILYRITGRGTRLLSEAEPGQKIRLVGPLGRGFPDLEDVDRSILVGGGTGIASLYELAARLEDRSRLRVLLGARDATQLMGRQDFVELGVDLRIRTEDGSEGRRGLVTESLQEALSERPADLVCACGPTGMMRSCAGIASAHGARCLVSLENVMACGFGVCLGCAAPLASGESALVCSQGPVMDAAAIDWDGLP